MKSDVIIVSSRGSQMGKALDQVEKISAYKDLSPKNALHLRLLTEEMMGLLRSITGETEGAFWIEDQDGNYEFHLRTSTRMTSTKREQLLSATTSGKNESARSFMGWIRDFFEQGADEDIGYAGSPLMMPELYEHSMSSSLDWEWSMIRYEQALAPRVERKEEKALEVWDGLEKSVVARLADEVKVSIKGQTVELIIYKKME